ncbi:MAG: ATP-binding protein [Bacteroidota bacterium]
MSQYPSKRPIRAILLIGFLFAFSAVAMVSSIAYFSVKDLAKSLKSVTEPKQNLITLKDVLAEIAKAESSVRAYTITRDPKDLKNFYTTFTKIDERLTNLRSIPLQQNHIDSVQTLVEEKFVVMSKLVEASEDQKVRTIFDMLADRLAASHITLGDSINSKAGAAVVDSALSKSAKLEDQRKEGRLFDKLFGKNGNVSDSLGAELQLSQEDVAPFLASIGNEDSLYSAQKRDMEALKQRVTLIRRLIKEDQFIMNKISFMVKRMEYKERVDSNDKSATAENKAVETIRLMSLLSFVGLALFIILVIFVATDISRNQRLQKRLEREKRRAEKLATAKEEFLANMSHEIRTPMNAIIGFTEQLSQGDLNHRQSRFVTTISNSAKYLLALINDVLDYSKLESGNFEMEKIGFRPRDVVRETLLTFQNSAKEKGIWLTAENIEALPKVVKGDPLRLKQMLFNLVSNALKFTEVGRVSINCAVHPASKKKKILEFTVVDTGIGIPEDKLDAIFADFKQVDSSTTRKYGGTGLGLSITKKLAEMHNGSISIDSRLGQGTQVTLKLLFEQGSAADLEEIDVRDVKDFSIFKGKRGLIADDAPYNLELIKVILHKWEVTADVVENGQQAVEKMANTHYDFILMDLQMPVMSGYEATVHARKVLKIDTPILALTATSTPGEIAKCEAAGMQDHLLKPFQEQELAVKLANLLRFKPRVYKETTVQPIITLEDMKLPAGSRPYNLDELVKLTNNNPAFMVNMLKIFVDNTPDYMKQMAVALQKDDWETVGAMAHKTIPSCRHLGLNTTVDKLKKIETAVKNKSGLKRLPDKVLEVLQELKDIVKMVEGDMKAIQKQI